MRFKIPKVVIKRLPIYLRTLLDLERRRVEMVSSQELGELTGVSSAQIRKDLAYFGDFGKPGVGYDVGYLLTNLRNILGLNKEIPVVLVGAGHLGTAFAHYNRIPRQGIKIGAIFDTDPQKVGRRVAGLKIRDMGELEETVGRLRARIAIIAVPAPAVQEVTKRLVEAGVRGVLNFAPVSLKVPENVHVHNLDTTLELQSLAFYVEQDTLRSSGAEPRG